MIASASILDLAYVGAVLGNMVLLAILWRMVP
jgi:hypothetical protein